MINDEYTIFLIKTILPQTASKSGEEISSNYKKS